MIIHLKNFDLDLDNLLPHKILFVDSSKSEEENRNNTFMYSTLYCLTNTKLFMKRFLPLAKTVVSKGEKDYKFFQMMELIYEDIQNEICNKYTLREIEAFKLSLGNDFRDPRPLIRYIFVYLLTTRGFESEIKTKSYSDFISSSDNINSNGSDSYDNSIDKSFINSYIWYIKEEDIEYDKYNIIIKNINNKMIKNLLHIILSGFF